MGCGSSKSSDTTNTTTTEPEQQNGATSNQEAKNETKPNDSNAKSTNSELQKFREQCLEHHNILRKKHGVGPMKLADDINDIAQKYADSLGKSGKFEHSDGSGLGENLAACTCSAGSFPTGEYICKMWYDEIKDYDFSNPGFGMNTGHFTQVVWRGSNELGIGIGYQKSGMCVVVANYRPAGNMMGDFPNNVPPTQ